MQIVVQSFVSERVLGHNNSTNHGYSKSRASCSSSNKSGKSFSNLAATSDAESYSVYEGKISARISDEGRIEERKQLANSFFKQISYQAPNYAASHKNVPSDTNENDCSAGCDSERSEEAVP